jgi:hypothetical protein
MWGYADDFTATTDTDPSDRGTPLFQVVWRKCPEAASSTTFIDSNVAHGS